MVDKSKNNLYTKQFEFLTKINPDCVKFCPIAQYQNLLMIAFYSLDAILQKVFGGLNLYEFKNKYIF